MDPNLGAASEGSSVNPIMDQSKWTSLSQQDRKTAIKTFEYFFPGVNFKDNLSKLTGSMLASLKQGSMPHFFQETLPQKLEHYVSRQVTTHNIISEGIFELVDIPDIFLCEGMGITALSKLLKGKLCSTSSEQLKFMGHPSVNFMTLDQPAHFISICQKTNQPVHLISKWSDGKLKWMRSRGSMENLKKHFGADTWEVLDEETFCENMSVIHTSSICISANPGMGKSALLSQIARRLRVKSPNLHVFFITMKKLVKLVKRGGISDLTDAIAKSLQDIVCANSFDEVVLQSILSSEKDFISIELMLDGLDDVDSSDFKLALDILQTIQCSFKSVRLWVTTRPHLLKKLESNLDFVLVNILPFTHQDKLDFLESFWSRNHSFSLDKQRIKVFAQDCLQSLINEIGSIDITGEPIHCLLIGENYEADAVAYSRLDRDSSWTTKTGTATSLYQLMIRKKLEKYKLIKSEDGPTSAEVISVHTHLSLKLLFPESLSSLGFSTSPSQNELEEGCKMGILKYENTSQTPNFIHSTFAHYFVALFVADKIRSNGFFKDGTDNFLLQQILKCSEETNSPFQFSHQLICHFVDSLITEITIGPSHTPPILSKDTLQKIAFACAQSDFQNIMKYLDELHLFDKHASALFNQEYLSFVIKNSSLDLVKLSYKHYEENHKFDPNAHLSFLLSAVRRGQYVISEFLVRNKSLFKFVSQSQNGTEQLLHYCVRRSDSDSEVQIFEKIKVLRMLVEINPTLLEQLDEHSRTPLLSPDVHIRLLIELVCLGSNTLAQDENGDTVLQLTSRERCLLSNEDYHLLVASIEEEQLQELVTGTGSNGHTPLSRLLRLIDPLPETLELFKKVGANFNHVTMDGCSILSHAIWYERSGQTIRHLSQLGADVNWSDGPKRMPLLHLAARNRNDNTMKMIQHLIHAGADVFLKDKTNRTFLTWFISSPFPPSPSEFHQLVEYLADMNLSFIFNISEGRHRSTPLHLAVKKIELEGRTLSLLHATNVDFNAVDLNGQSMLAYAIRGRRSTQFLSSLMEFVTYWNILARQSRNLLHIAAQYGTSASLKLFIELGVFDINGVNKKGDTPLHCAILDEENSYEKCTLLIEAGANFRIRNKEGSIPLSIALEMYRWTDKVDIIQLLAHKYLMGLTKQELEGREVSKLHHRKEEFIGSGERLIQSGLFPTASKKQPGNKFHSLLKSQGNEYWTNSFATETLHLVITQAGNLDDTAFQSLLLKCEQHGADFHFSDGFGYSLLHNAVSSNHLRAIRFLLKKGIDINIQNNWQETPLHLASYCINDIDSSLKVIEYLIDHGADVCAQDSKNRTFVHTFVAHSDHLPFHFDLLVKYLHIKGYLHLFNVPGGSYETTPFQLEVDCQEIRRESLSLMYTNGVNFNASDKNGDSILSYAISRNRSLSFICDLVDKFGVDCTSLNSMKNNLLHIAAMEGTMETFKFLLGLESLKKSINGQDMKGNTPLHYALHGFDSEDTSLKKCRLLVSNGANVNSANNLGEAPLSLVTQWVDQGTSLKAIQFLIDNGANVFLKDSNNATFLHVLLARLPEPSSSLFRDIVRYLDGKNLLGVLEAK